jgi:hypothetical protein
VPTAAWAWGSAALAALTVAIPAATLHVASYGRPPLVETRTALGRLAPLALVVGAAVWWRYAEGIAMDGRALVWGALLALTGALVASGLRQPRQPLVRTGAVVAALALLPPVAAGLLTWSSAVVGAPTWTVDRSTRVFAVVALVGAGWIWLQPWLARALGRAWLGWWSVVLADAEARSASRAVRRRPSRAAPVPAGGRHRA